MSASKRGERTWSALSISVIVLGTSVRAEVDITPFSSSVRPGILMVCWSSGSQPRARPKTSSSSFSRASEVAWAFSRARMRASTMFSRTPGRNWNSTSKIAAPSYNSANTYHPRPLKKFPWLLAVSTVASAAAL